jgi:uncharacterized protein YndB with AHSA1/START domain
MPRRRACSTPGPTPRPRPPGLPDQRIVYANDMHLDDKRISVSLATVEFKPVGSAGTRLIFTEQAVFLDGYDDAESRERGTRGLLDKLEMALRG